MNLNLSSLNHSFIIDIDGTIFKHNGHLDGEDSLLDGVIEFWQKIPVSDFILLLTSRKEKFKQTTENALKKNGLRFDLIIYDVPTGERVLINDAKPSGLKTAHAINLKRNEGFGNRKIVINSNM